MVVRQHNCLVLSFVLVLATVNVVVNGQKKMFKATLRKLDDRIF